MSETVRYPLDFRNAPQRRRPAGLPESLSVDRTLIMGVLNVTPDSFSDGGTHNTYADAIRHAELLVSQGADIIDVGGESTRPGGARVSADEELTRTIDVVRALTERGIVVSIDTMRAVVAREAVAAGALIVNDVAGGLADDDMLPTVAELRTHLDAAPVYAAMHWRAHSESAVKAAGYSSVGPDVARELGERLDAAVTCGLPPESLVADPGFGFSKTGEDNWDLFDGIEPVENLGYPMLIGVSRKRFLAALDTDRDAATAAVSGVCQARRAWAVRVHDVPSTLANIRVMQRLMAGPDGRGLGLGAAIADREYGTPA